MSGEILVTREADVATVTLSNPPKLNALTVAMWRELATAMHRLSEDDALRCVVLRGAGSVLEGRLWRAGAGREGTDFPAGSRIAVCVEGLLVE